VLISAAGRPAVPRRVWGLFIIGISFLAAQRRVAPKFPIGEVRVLAASRLTLQKRPPIFAEGCRFAEKMTKDTFGEHLKREREMRGVSLDEIAAATRIATRFLQAIEDEQWDQLPGGVFNRGFVRAVARYLGLDEENTVAEYVSAAGDRPTVPVWTGSPPAVAPEQPWLAWILAAVIVLLLATATWFAVRRFIAWRASRRAAPIAAQSEARSPRQAELASTTVARRFLPEGRGSTARDKNELSAGDAGALLLILTRKTLALIGPRRYEASETLAAQSLRGTMGGGH
jgi:hypothetical protein